MSCGWASHGGERGLCTTLGLPNGSRHLPADLAGRGVELAVVDGKDEVVRCFFFSKERGDPSLSVKLFGAGDCKRSGDAWACAKPLG